MDKKQLLGMTYAELEQFVVGELGESKFRAKQISEWLARGADIDGMTNLSLALREQLKGMAVAQPAISSVVSARALLVLSAARKAAFCVALVSPLIISFITIYASS